jgi:hypothetical protein
LYCDRDKSLDIEVSGTVASGIFLKYLIGEPQ